MRTLSNKKNLISNHPKLMGGIVLIYRIFRYMLIYLINGPRNFFILIWLTNMEGGSWGQALLYRFLFFDNSIINSSRRRGFGSWFYLWRRSNDAAYKPLGYCIFFFFFFWEMGYCIWFQLFLVLFPIMHNI